MREKNLETKENGITLIALVITIVVLLILAGITITYVLGDNSVFKQASEAKLKTDIARYKEMLETAKAPIITEGLENFNPAKYFEEIKKQGIIEEKDTAVIDNGDGTYDVTTKPGYVFLVELMPSKENPKDAKITYIGQAGKILPIIKKIEVSATSTSITGKAIVSRLGSSGTVEYYYKLATEKDKDYKLISNVNGETGATQSTGITAGEKYIIKVIAKNEVGESVDTEEITATKIYVNSVTITPNTATVKVGQTTTLTAEVKPDNSTNKSLKWESGDSTKVTVTENEDGTVTLTGVSAGTTTITATAKDGSDKSGTCSVTVIEPVRVTKVSLNRSSINVKPGQSQSITLVATVTPEGADDKSVIWDSSNKAVATVSQTGVVTVPSGVTSGTTTITVTSNDDNTKTASCTVEITEESDWEELAEWAEYIATHESEVTGTGTSKTAKRFAGDTSPLQVGDTFKVKYEDDLVEVEIIDFLHDDLAEGVSYASNPNKTKAGITFDFQDCIAKGKGKMHSASACEGWGGSDMRNGQVRCRVFNNTRYKKQFKYKFKECNKNSKKRNV